MLLDPNFAYLKFSAVHKQEIIEHPAYFNMRGRGVLPAKTKGLARNMRHPFQLVYGELQMPFSFGAVRYVPFSQEKQVGYRLKRIIDLVRNGPCKAPYGRELFRDD